MAELLGLIASGIAVAQLATSIVSSVQKTRALWTNFNSAPQQVGDALMEIELLNKVIGSLELKDDGEEVVSEALIFCAEVLAELEGACRSWS